MKQLSFVLLVLFFLIPACRKENVQPTKAAENSVTQKVFLPLISYTGTGQQAVVSKSSNATRVTKIIKFNMSGTLEFIPDASVCNGYIQVLVHGYGNVSHLGFSMVELSFCSDGVNALSAPSGSITADNGDQVFSEMYNAGFDPQVNMYFEEHRWTGGTGRFMGAEGSVRLNFTLLDLVNLKFTNYGEGTITY